MPTLIQEHSKKIGRARLLHFLLIRSVRLDRALSIAAKARIAAARPLAGTLSAGSLAAKALIAAARA